MSFCLLVLHLFQWCLHCWSEPRDFLSGVCSTSTSVTSIVSVNLISSATACSDNSVASLSPAGSTRTACEIPVFPVSSVSSVTSLGTASSAVVSELSLCSYLGSASFEVSEFFLGTASSVAISGLFPMFVPGFYNFCDV